MYLILKLKTDRLNTWFGCCGITDVSSSALRPLFCLDLHRILSLMDLASYWKYMIVIVKQTDFTDVYFRFYVGHNSWPMLYLFILWILWSTHTKKILRYGQPFFIYPWYLTRKVFNLEKLNLFNTQNWKGLFWFLSPVLFCFFTELSSNCIPCHISLRGEPVGCAVSMGCVSVCGSATAVFPDYILDQIRLESPSLLAFYNRSKTLKPVLFYVFHWFIPYSQAIRLMYTIT